MNSRKHVLRLALATAMACTGLAQAATPYNLRNIYVEVDSDDTSVFEDFYNNNNPQTVGPGSGYFGSLVTPNPLYGVRGSFTGAETTPGDFTVDGNVVGQLQFSRANATAPTPLVVNGINYLDQVNQIRLNNPVGQSSLLTNSRGSFDVATAWSLVTPDLNSRYGMRLNDSSGGSFNDLISLDIVRMADGSAGAQIRRIAGDAAGNRTITGAETRSLSNALAAGHTIDEVNVVLLGLSWNANENRVRGEVELIKITDGGATLSELGHIEFNTRYEIFRGETTTAFESRASWTELAPVPEPSTYALMLVGIAGLGAMAKRRRAG
jgi:PEP-CTERM motif